MLQSIRDKSQGWLAWVVVIILIATFALWGVHSYITAEKDDNVAARVNKTVITTAEVNAVYDRLRQQEQMQMGANFSLNQNAEALLRKQALNQLIVSTVLIDAAHNAGYRVTTDQVNEALLQIPAFQVNGQFSIDRFQEILGNILYAQDQFLADMRNAMLINQVQGGYVNSEFALPGEIAAAIRLVNQKRDISYMVIPAARFTTQVKISPAEIQQYYQTHANQFQSPEQVSVNYLVLSLPQIKANLHFDTANLQQYYENNIQNYTQPASWHVAYILVRVPQNPSMAEQQAAQNKINTITAALKNGADFAQLARQYSDDKASASHGGELDWFSAGTLDPQFEKAAANLQKAGDVSQPVRTSYGFVIIKLLGIRNPQAMPFAEVKQQVSEALAQQQAQQIFADESDKLSNLTYANPNTLDVAAKALGLTVQTTDLFSQQGGKQGITANPHFVSAAFSPDVLQQGNNSDVIQIDANTLAVLRVKQHKPASVLPLADMENTIKSALASKKTQLQAQQLGQQLVTQLQNRSATPQQLSAKFNLPLQVDKNAGRYDPRLDSMILNQAFQMPRPTVSAPAISGLTLPSGDYAVILLNAVHDGQPSNNGIEKRIYQEQLENNLGQISYQLYVRDLLKKTKIKINNNAASSDTDTDSIS